MNDLEMVRISPHLSLNAVFRQYRASSRISSSAEGFTWTCRELPDHGFRLEVTWQGAGPSQPSAFGVEVVAGVWGPEPYVVIPGSVYAGNRFRCNASAYPCLLDDPADWIPDVETTISDVPRLSINSGPSRVQQITGDAATPGIGVAGPDQGLWLAAVPQTEIGFVLLEVEESDDRTQTAIRILTPGVREDLRYHGGPTWVPSEDRGYVFEPGETRSLEFWVQPVDQGGPQALFRIFAAVVARYAEARPCPRLPFSEAYRLIEENHQLLHWDEADGFYACGDRSQPYAHWQMGWVGGGMSAYALHVEGTPLSRSRAVRNLDFAVNKGQAPSGLFWSFANPDCVFGDMIDMDYGQDWHLVRRSGDGLYFLSRLLDRLDDPSPRARKGLEEVGDALLSIWRRYGQFGMFVSDKNNDILVGGTTSGAIIPAALAAGAQVLGRPDWLEAALEIGRVLATKWLALGYTNGGPGEAAQCPDSESAFALVESLVELYEATQDASLLPLAEDAAYHAWTWVMPYDFPFPPDSSLGRIQAHTRGSVWANAQNKHSAPGICTLSGVSLLKLARATGNRQWIDLLRDIAFGLPQYLSRPDQPIFELPSGQMCERVNTCDWETPDIGVGEGFPFGCWCEVSMLLTYAEVPGVYLETDTGAMWVMDHIQATATRHDDGWNLSLTNPTAFPARVSILAESADRRAQPLGLQPLKRALWQELPSGATVEVYVQAD
ncbi:MAG: hypothetical protein ACOYON_07950 [Fimbriimonas sp.]